MDAPEPNTHSFVIRIWLEETALEGERANWRGHITHVLTRERRYVEQPDDIFLFILPFLQAMGIRFSLWWRLRQWRHQRRAAQAARPALNHNPTGHE